MNDEQLLSTLCPNCHLACLAEHPETWRYNKCRFCGYTEESGKTEERITLNIKKNPEFK